MSQNVDLVYRIADAIDGGDVSEFLAPEFRIANVNTAITDKTYVGADGAREWKSDLFSGFADGAHYQVDEIVAECDDYVVAIVSIVGRGAASDAPLHLRWVTAQWFRDGKCTHAAGFLSRRDALRAVGLAA